MLVAEHRPRFEVELAAEEGNLTEPSEAAAARALRVAWTAYLGSYDAFLLAPPEAARRLYLEQRLP